MKSPQKDGAVPDPRDRIFDTTEIERHLGRRAGNASLFALAIMVVKVLQQFVSIAIIARLVPPAEYGIYAMALPGVMIAMALSNFGLPQAIVQRRTIGHAKASALFWLNMLFAVLVAGAVVLLAGPAAAYYDTPEVRPVFQAVSLSLLFSAMSSQYLAILQRTLRIRDAELLTLAAELIGLAVAIVAALSGLSYWALVLQQIVTPLLKTLFMGLRIGWWPSWPSRPMFAGAMDSVSFGGFVAGYSILNRLAEYIGTAIVGGNFDPAAAGLFYRARNLAGIAPKRVMNPLSGVFVPTMSRLQDDPEALRAMFRRLISRANLVLLPVAVLIAAGAEPIVALLLGRDWMAAVPLLFLMSAFTFREAGSAGLQFALVACGQSRPLFVYSAVRLVAITAAMLLAAPHGLLVMSQVYVAAELCLTLPYMVAVAHRATPIGVGVFLDACLADMAIAVGIGAALVMVVNPALPGDLPAYLHLALLGLLIGIAYAIRIAVSAELRTEFGRIASRVTGRLTKT